MKALLLSLLMMLFITPSAPSQNTVSHPKPASNAESQLKKVNSEWFGAFRKGDAAAFDRLTTEDFIITSVNGEVRNKAQMMRNNPIPRLDPTETYSNEDVKVRIYGDTAILTGQVTTKALNKSSVSLRYTNVFVKLKGFWLIAASQLTRVVE